MQFRAAIVLLVATAIGRSLAFGADHAFASASGHVFDQDQEAILADQSNAGPTAAQAAINASGSGGFITASAGVTSTNGAIELRAGAQSQTGMIGSEAIESSGGATARWTDVLRLDNPDLVDVSVLGTAFFFFVTGCSGTLGSNGEADFGVQLFDDMRLTHFAGAGEQHASSLFKVEGVAFAPIGDILPPMFLEMFVAVSVSAPEGTSAFADFSHTATLGTIYIGDANGNFLPGTENIHLIGESGVVYDVRPFTVPEPSTAVLALIGLVFVAVRRGNGKRRPRVEG